MKFVSFEWNGIEQYGVIDEQTNDILNLSSVVENKENFSLPLTLIEGIKQGDSFVAEVDRALRKLEKEKETF